MLSRKSAEMLNNNNEDLSVEVDSSTSCKGDAYESSAFSWHIYHSVILSFSFSLARFACWTPTTSSPLSSIPYSFTFSLLPFLSLWNIYIILGFLRFINFRLTSSELSYLRGSVPRFEHGCQLVCLYRQLKNEGSLVDPSHCPSLISLDANHKLCAFS